MSNTTEFTEYTIYQYITKFLPTKTIKNIFDRDDILNSLPEDAVEDLKDQVWEYIKDELNYGRIAEMIKDWLKEVCDSDIESDDDEEKKSESDNDSSSD